MTKGKKFLSVNDYPAHRPGFIWREPGKLAGSASAQTKKIEKIGYFLMQYL